jgi:hypothetical protein
MKVSFLTSVALFAFGSTVRKDKKAAETEDIALKWTGKTIFSILLFCTLCSLTLFISSYRFVNPTVAPKWFGTVICVSLSGILLRILYLNIYVPVKSIFLLILISGSAVYLQMLLADNYKNLNRAEEAENHLLLSSGMCPNRFMPLYQLVLLYNETGRNKEALALARLIDKEVKIPSVTVTAIKDEMQKLIDRQENYRTNVQPLTQVGHQAGLTNKQHGQDDLSEETPKGLLPP